MCGIIGYVGKENAADVALEALRTLSYRGYDSAGISVLCREEKGIKTVKTAGKIGKLEERLSKSPLPDSRAAIGHTRWATHGAVTDVNSHPHGTERVMLVHNGIIENYRSIKAKLLKLGYEFTSDTDTEAAALLIDWYYRGSGDPIRAIREAAAKLRGTFAFCVIFSDIPDTVFATRKESPLLIGIGEGEFFAASDLPAFLPYTKKHLRLCDLEIARLDPSGVLVLDAVGKPKKYDTELAEYGESAADLQGFSHFMRKEIDEESKIASELLRLYFSASGTPLDKIDGGRLLSSKKITVVGCGTAYHAGLYLKYLLEKLARVDTVCEIASEIRYSDPMIGADDTVIFISQSGETADTLSSLRMLKARGAYTVAIVNVRGSSIASEADTVLYTHAGSEIAVASTKAYTAQCTVAAAFAIRAARLLGRVAPDEEKRLLSEISLLPDLIRAAIKNEPAIKRAAEQIKLAEHVFFIGRRADHIAAMEGSLKLKEVTYIHSECYPAGELKHGAISLITENTPVIALFSDPDVREKTLSNLKEAAARGAMTVAVTPRDEEISQAASTVIEIRSGGGIFAPIALATTLQLFAYHTAVALCRDVDQPRNLAKSVTVE